MYIIYGSYQEQTEEIDTAETRKEAVYLLKEYRTAFGSDWSLTFRKSRKTGKD